MKYDGNVTPHDDKLISKLAEDQAILEDDQDVFKALKGHKWTEIPNEILESQPDGYVLLADEAFAAFVPAWLLRALDNIDGESEVRNFFVYAFSPKHDMVPNTTEIVLHRLRLLNVEQRSVVLSLLTEFTKRGTTRFVRDLATKAVNLFDKLD